MQDIDGYARRKYIMGVIHDVSQWIILYFITELKMVIRIGIGEMIL
jgi:hypothetical protein